MPLKVALIDDDMKNKSKHVLLRGGTPLPPTTTVKQDFVLLCDICQHCVVSYNLWLSSGESFLFHTKVDRAESQAE